jgi:amino acid transporter
VSKTAIILVAMIIVAVQFALIVPATMHDTAFRHQARLEGHESAVDTPTPATQAAFQLSLIGMVVGLLLSVIKIIIYFRASAWKNPDEYI